MKAILFAALPLGLLAAPAFAGPDCEGVEAATPMWQVARTFEEGGGEIREMKIEDGCYEIKGTVAGKRLEIYFDPKSGAELEREES